MEREKVTFEVNVPVTVAIDPRFPRGKPVEGRYGDQVLFYWTEDRLSYVEPEVAEQIQALGLRPGEAFLVTKRQMRDGNRKWMEWQVERPAAPAPQVCAANGAGKPNGHPITDGPNGSTKPNGGAPAEPAIPLSMPGEALKQSLRLALEAAKDAAEYGAKIGYPMQLQGNEVQDMAVTLFIQRCRDGGVRWH